MAKIRPAWVDDELFPFDSRFTDVDGNTVHYVDEGDGPTLLLLHGNPTWAFLYRELIRGLRDRFRCVAVDYPGFGLSTAREGYRFTAREHTDVLASVVSRLDLTDVTPMVQDWGGPIGFGAAGRAPDRYRGFIVGNTWAWPMSPDASGGRFSKIMGGTAGTWAIENLNVFVNQIIPAGHRRRKLTSTEMSQYRGPFPTQASREPVAVFPREILDAAEFLKEVESGLTELARKPALILWGDRDQAFKEKERGRFEATFADHTTHILRGAGHYIQDDASGEILGLIPEWFAERGSPESERA